MTKVSILIPIYNVERYLEKCLDSVINQSLKDIEILCLNDGSTDSSFSIMKKYAESDDRIRIINKENSGYGDTMNIGLDCALGEYIGIVESDDFAELDMFDKLYDIAKKNDAQVVKSNFYFYYEKQDRNEFSELISIAENGKIINPSIENDIFYRKPTIWSAIYQREFLIINNINFTTTPGASYQDAAFNFKVWACAEKVYLTHKPYIHYRQDNSNSSVNSSSKIYCVCDEYEEMQNFLEKDIQKRNILEKILYKMKFDTYIWNYERIDDRFKLKFLMRMSEEFKAHLEGNKLDIKLFDSWKWWSINLIIEEPVTYHTLYITQREIRKNNEENSLAKKIRNNIREHGMKHTIKKIGKKILNIR